MKSSIEGCTRFCDTCPMRNLSALQLDYDDIHRVRREIQSGNDMAELKPMEPTDQLEVDTVTPINHMISSWDKNDGPDAVTVQFGHSDKLIMSERYQFPYTTTLDMVSDCTGPHKVKTGLFRSALVCGAYEAGITALPLSGLQREAYLDLLSRDKAKADRRNKEDR